MTEITADDGDQQTTPVNVEVAADPPPPEPPESAPEPASAPEPDPQATAAEHGDKRKQAWWMRELANKDAEAANLRRELEAANELARRLQNPGVAGAQEIAPPPSVTEAQIEARAAELVVKADVRDLDVRGTEKYGEDWTAAVGVLNTLGANNLAFMGDILTADKANAADLVHTLASQPEKLATLMRLPPGARVAELTRISMVSKQLSADPKAPPGSPKQVSKAPAPPPSLNAGGKKAVAWYADDASDAEFHAGWEEMAKERAKRGGHFR
jgi:hypothetical protein